MADAVGMQVTPDALREVKREIDKLDEQLDLSLGAGSATRKKSVISEIVDETQENWKQLVDRVTETISKVDDPKIVCGTVHALLSTLNSVFDEDISEFLDKELENRKDENTKKLSGEELEKVKEKRAELLKTFKALKSVLEVLGAEKEIASIGNPKIRRGGAGKRKPRITSLYHYRVNETDLQGDADSLSTVATMCGIGTRELKKFISDQKIDLKKPPAEWEAKLPGDMGTLYAVKTVDDSSDEDEDEDEVSEEEETSVNEEEEVTETV